MTWPAWLRAETVLAWIVLALAWAVDPARLPFGSICPSVRVLDRECGGCGLTRAFHAISHGEFAEAWRFNPFGFAFYAIAVVAALWPLLERFTPRIARALSHRRAVPIGAIVLAAAVVLFGFWRDPIGVRD